MERSFPHCVIKFVLSSLLLFYPPSCFTFEALGIPYELVGASEINPSFRSVIQANFTVKHLHNTMKDQVDSAACLLHRDSCDSCRLTPCDLAIFGTPCPPFSEQRTKRYRSGSVKEHPLTRVTMEDARDMIVLGGHKAVVMEQVQGFDRAEVAGDAEFTPMRRQDMSSSC